MPDRYRRDYANGGTKHIILDGPILEVVFVGPSHVELSQRVTRLLNEDEAKKEREDAEDKSAFPFCG